MDIPVNKNIFPQAIIEIIRDCSWTDTSVILKKLNAGKSLLSALEVV